MLKKTFFLLIQYLLPQHFLSRLSGYIANHTNPVFKNFLIRLAMRHYNISLNEAKRASIDDYISFNDFFTRKLKPESRPIDPSPYGFCAPSDGIIYQYGHIQEQTLIQAKDKCFTIEDLIASRDQTMLTSFQDGYFFTIYLSPDSYHRVHMPVKGSVKHMKYVPGKLFSVNPITNEHVDQLFARNERVICHFDTPIGPMMIIMIGAFFVASIATSWHGIVMPSSDKLHHSRKWHYKPGTVELDKGDEIGHFQFGSSVICLLPPVLQNWDGKIKPGQKIKMGERMGLLAH
jgi:phosphatidylserine decarboxylase